MLEHIEICFGYKSEENWPPDEYAFFGCLEHNPDYLKDECGYCQNEDGDVCEVCGKYCLWARDYEHSYPAYTRVAAKPEEIAKEFNEYVYRRFDDWFENTYVWECKWGDTGQNIIRHGTVDGVRKTKSIIVKTEIKKFNGGIWDRDRKANKHGELELHIMGLEILSEDEFKEVRHRIVTRKEGWTEIEAEASMDWPVRFNTAFPENPERMR